MVADTWKPFRMVRCIRCKRRFPEGQFGSYWKYCGTCYRKIKPR